MALKGDILHKERLGEKYTSKQGYEVEIVDYISSLNSTIRFGDERATILKNIEYDRIKKGTVINPYHPNKYNGFIGEGNYKSSINDKSTLSYKVWMDMLKRVYSEKYHVLKPTYKDINLCEEWHNFQNFAEWYSKNWEEHMTGWKLDKDIICPDCKIYSPETCAFVPDDIGGMFISSKSYRGELPIGVTKHKSHYEAYFRGKFLAYSKNDINYLFYFYKEVRENYTKEIAENYKGTVDDRIYQALINFEINITD